MLFFLWVYPPKIFLKLLFLIIFATMTVEDWCQVSNLPRAPNRQLAQVKKILPFEGVFTLGADLEAVAAEPLQELLALLDGFCIEAKGPEVVQRLGFTATGLSELSFRSFQIL